jgi:hypothetical protein
LVVGVVFDPTGDFLASAAVVADLVVRGRDAIESVGGATVTVGAGATVAESRPTESTFALPAPRQAITTTTDPSIANSLIIFS